MLGALKWLGLLCKSRTARLVLLLTQRVVLLADVATAYLERGRLGEVVRNVYYIYIYLYNRYIYIYNYM